MSACTAACWTDVDCTVCGKIKARSGRSEPMECYGGHCQPECPGYYQPPKAPHLFSPCDSARGYSDPEGWAAHVAECKWCREEDE